MGADQQQEDAIRAKGLAGGLGVWIGVLSAAVTVVLTVLNAYQSNKIARIEADLQQRQVELDAAKERLGRYSFVQGLLGNLLQSNKAQQTLTINLITLALSDDEAKKLFAGFQLSDNATIQDMGRIGLSTIGIADLVSQMNNAVGSTRKEAVDILIRTHRANPAAVDQAVATLEPTRVQSLSASGRINVLVFLRNTEPAAWNPEQVARARQAIDAMRRSATPRASGIGPQTDDAMKRLLVHLDQVQASF